MKYQPHNDYEIIALIQEGNEEAFALMVDKYSRFISKNIYKYNLAYDYEDLHQEGVLVLYKSVMKFDPSFNKTFTRFFEMNLQRFYISYIKTLRGRTHIEVTHYHEIKENIHQVNENSVYFYSHLDELKNVLTEQEYRVYILREVKNFTVDLIAETLSVNNKSVYNSLHRAKSKIKTYFEE